HFIIAQIALNPIPSELGGSPAAQHNNNPSDRPTVLVDIPTFRSAQKRCAEIDLIIQGKLLAPEVGANLFQQLDVHPRPFRSGSRLPPSDRDRQPRSEGRG